jgi:hypothetical protein
MKSCVVSVVVASVEEHDVGASLVDELVEFAGLQVRAAADDAVLVDRDLAGDAEGDDLVAHLHGEAGEVEAETVLIEAGAGRPFEVDALEGLVLLGLAHVCLERRHVSAEGAVETVLGDDDAPAQPQQFAEVALPQPDRLGVGDRREHVVEQNLCGHGSRVRGMP